MRKSSVSNIVRMDWLYNRTPTGKRSATKARKLAQYFALGRGREKEQALRPQRGQWLDQNGQPCSHEAVLQWVRQQGMANLLTHQFILSVKETQLTPEAFNRAMAAGGELFPEWRLIRHEDSRYPHAHALAFGQKEVLIKSEAFQTWWQGVRAALEREQAAAQEMQLVQAQAQERAAEVQQMQVQMQPEAGAEQQRRVQMQREAAAEQSSQWPKQSGTELADDTLNQEQEKHQSWGLGM